MSETKTELIQLRITPTDKDTIRQLAHVEGISMSQYIVREATKGVVVSASQQIVNPTQAEIQEAEDVETAVVRAETSEA